MEEFHLDGSIFPMVSRFEEMLKRNEAYYFERQDLEDIVDYYIQENAPQKAMRAIRFADSQYPDTSFFTLRKAQLWASNGKHQEALDAVEHLILFENISQFRLRQTHFTGNHLLI